MQISNRQLFLNHVAQVSPKPMDLEIVKAAGVHLYDAQGKSYIDFISGKEIELNSLVKEIVNREEKVIIWTNYIYNVDYFCKKFGVENNFVVVLSRY